MKEFSQLFLHPFIKLLAALIFKAYGFPSLYARYLFWSFKTPFKEFHLLKSNSIHGKLQSVVACNKPGFSHHYEASSKALRTKPWKLIPQRNIFKC